MAQFVSKMTYSVSSRTLNFAHSLTYMAHTRVHWALALSTGIEAISLADASHPEGKEEWPTHVVQTDIAY